MDRITKRVGPLKFSGPLAILVALGLVAGACGGSEALTKAEYIEQGNAICAASNAQIELVFEGVFTDFPDEPSPQQLYEAFGEIAAGFIPIMEAQLSDLRELAPPKDDKETLGVLLDDVETVVEEAGQLAEDAAAGDQAAIDRIDSSDDPFADVNRRAQEYGLTVCGEDF